MSNIRYILLFTVLLFSFRISLSQFVTLNGKQFYDQSGQPFYPVVCNYLVQLTCNNCQNIDNSNGWCTSCNVNDFSVQPENRFGNSFGYEASFTGGISRIEADFTKMLQMGFNTVRVMGFNINIHDENSTDPQATIGGRFICHEHNNPTSGQAWWGHPIKAQDDFSTSWITQNVVFPQIQNVLQAAENAGIKVILVTGGNAVSASRVSGYAAKLVQATKYKQFLEALAATISTESSLLAYDLYNEPAFNLWDGAGNPLCTSIKSEICEFTALWYDAIKAIDPNHLITMGNSDVYDIFHYDPTIMKLDFNSYHIYPFWYVYERENYNLQLPIDRMESQFYWFNNNSSMPYMLGETGASAWSSDNQGSIVGQNTNVTQINFTNNNIGQDLTQMPVVWGTYEDQSDFAQQTEAIVINHGGSGYSWWLFQDCIRNGSQSLFDGDVHYNFSNLLERGSISSTNPILANSVWTYNNSLDKPIVTDAFSSNTLIQPSSASIMPTNYYNAFGGNPLTNYRCTGTIVDQNNQPIKDAVIRAFNFWHGDTVNPVPEDLRFTSFTFSDESGEFETVSPIINTLSDPLNPNSLDYSKFKRVEISAPGANVVQIGDWQLDAISNTNHVPIPTNLSTLTRQPGVFDKSLSLLNVNSTNSPIAYKARHKLAVQNSTVQSTGVADFYASMEVELKPNFEAMQGSETYIYCKPAQFDCGQAPTSKTNNTTPNNYKRKADADKKSLILEYDMQNYRIVLSPNPAKEFLKLASNFRGEVEIKILDMYGRILIQKSDYMDGNISINTSQLVPAQYHLQLSFMDFISIQKFVIL